jgi:hypothetical protein
MDGYGIIIGNCNKTALAKNLENRMIISFRGQLIRKKEK